MNEVIKKSITQTNVAINKQVTMTTIVDSFNCCFEGHETFFISLETSPEYCLIFAIIKFLWHLLAVARAVGLEPTTYGFGDRCSTDWATPVNAVNACKELMNGIEPSTSSLPRKCSTNWATSAFMQNNGTAMIRLSGRRDSNSRPTAWKAVTLPTELLPHFKCSQLCGQGRIRTSEGEAGRFTVCSIWPLWYLPFTMQRPQS